MKIKNIKILSAFLFVLFFSQPIFSTINSLQQYGLSLGDLPDVESDTFFVNPAYGYTARRPEIFANFYHNQTAVLRNCDENNGYCDMLVLNNAFLDLHYIQPVNALFGFFLEATTLFRNNRYTADQDSSYGAADGGAGFWFRIIPGLNFGISGKYYSDKYLEEDGHTTGDERTSDAYSVKAGFSIDFSSKWNLGYSIQYNPDELAGAASSLVYAYNTYLYPFSSSYNTDFYHNITVRGEISNIVFVSNRVFLGLDDYLQKVSAISLWGLKAGSNFIFAGIRYTFFNTDSPEFFPDSYHTINLHTGAEFPLFFWLKFRLGLNSYYVYFPANTDYNYLTTLPDFSAGLDFLLGPKVNLEFNFSSGLTSWGYFSTNFELNFKLK